MSEVPCRKRDDYLEWPEYFMAVAFLSAQRSKDPNSQVSECSGRMFGPSLAQRSLQIEHIMKGKERLHGCLSPERQRKSVSCAASLGAFMFHIPSFTASCARSGVRGCFLGLMGAARESEQGDRESSYHTAGSRTLALELCKLVVSFTARPGADGPRDVTSVWTRFPVGRSLHRERREQDCRHRV